MIPTQPTNDLNHADSLLRENFLTAKSLFESENPNRFIRVTSVYRPQAIQEVLYAQGRANLEAVNGRRITLGLPPITAAENRIITWTRSSLHTVYPSRAIDIAILFDPDGPSGPLKPLLDYKDLEPYRKFGEIAKELHLIWGGNFSKPDFCHIQIGT